MCFCNKWRLRLYIVFHRLPTPFQNFWIPLYSRAKNCQRMTKRHENTVEHSPVFGFFLQSCLLYGISRQQMKQMTENLTTCKHPRQPRIRKQTFARRQRAQRSTGKRSQSLKTCFPAFRPHPAGTSSSCSVNQPLRLRTEHHKNRGAIGRVD